MSLNSVGSLNVPENKGPAVSVLVLPIEDHIVSEGPRVQLILSQVEAPLKRSTSHATVWEQRDEVQALPDLTWELGEVGCL
jgi:hypothetical protein